MDGCWELDGISAEPGENVCYARERDAMAPGEEEPRRFELRVGAAAEFERCRSPVAQPAQRHRLAQRSDEDPLLEVLQAIEPGAALPRPMNAARCPSAASATTGPPV